jgi:hypothetical protein
VESVTNDPRRFFVWALGNHNHWQPGIRDGQDWRNRGVSDIEESLRKGNAAKDETVNLSALKERGWTNAAVRKFLGTADFTKPNPFYRTGPTMKLYRLARVITAESTVEFLAFKVVAERRSKSATDAAAKRREETLAWAERVDIDVQKHSSLSRVRNQAIRHYNDRAEWGYDSASTESDPRFLDRITVNFLRHELSNYESLLADKFGRVGADEAYSVLKVRILSAIGATYPELQPEASRQAGQEAVA